MGLNFGLRAGVVLTRARGDFESFLSGMVIMLLSGRVRRKKLEGTIMS
jgi:hypothetical protein